MKNRKVLGNRKDGSSYIRNNNSVIDYVQGERLSLRRQIVSAGFDTIPMPVKVSMWRHFYSKEEKGLATFDIDGAVTTIVEMLQPRSVSDLGCSPAVYSNDRQVRPGCESEEAVASRKFEKVVLLIWAPDSFNLIDDLIDVEKALKAAISNDQYDEYDMLQELLT